MNTLYKLVLITAAIMAFASCKKDAPVQVSSNIEEIKAQKIQDNLIRAKERADSTVLADQAERDSLLVQQEQKKKVRKKTTFNPPHIAVLESSYEEIKKEKPAKKKKVVAPKKKATKPVAKTNVKPVAPAVKPVSKQTSSTKVVKSVEPVLAEDKLTEMVFKRNFFSFGEIIQGDTIYFEYAFTNIGTEPLIIKDATATCGCTHPSFPFTPIPPGETGQITGMYISTTKKGPQNAMVKVVANTEPAIHKLMLDGTVLVPEDKEAGR